MNTNVDDVAQIYQEHASSIDANVNLYTITFADDSNKGNHVGIQITIVNAVGEMNSPQLVVIQAGVPAKPTPAPIVDYDNTFTNQIAVRIANTASDGGSQITQYEL